MKSVLRLVVFFVAVSPLAAEWKEITPGVDYREWVGGGRAIHVTRVDLRNPAIELTATAERDRATTVSEYARRNNALIAINGDYFDEKRKPIGLTVGACGPWAGTPDTSREAVFYIDGRRGRIQPSREILADTEGIATAISGWPVLVTGCEALSAEELPGSDAFTRRPHPRSALGLSRDRTRLYMVVADGRRDGVPGLTLAELSKFMAETLDVCSALNLDGGGSTAMWVAGCVVNVPSEGRERVVANHLAVVMSEDLVACDTKKAASPTYSAVCPVTRSLPSPPVPSAKPAAR